MLSPDSKTRNLLHPEKAHVPHPTIERMSAYLQCVRALHAEGIATASSTQIAQCTGINAAQFRKDLSYFGEFGTPGLGYDVVDLRDHLSRIMGLCETCGVLLVGAGNLGAALASYMGFGERGFRVTAIFDNDEAKVGTQLGGIEVHSMSAMTQVNAQLKARFGAIAVPRGGAQNAADTLVAAGISAILNFAPTSLSVPDGVVVRHVDFTSELEVLSYYLQSRT